MGSDLKSKKYLFLSDSDRESAKSRLAVAGIPYVKKRLESGPSNWSKIVAIIDDEDLIGILVKLTDSTMRLMLSKEYQSARNDLLARLSVRPHVIFVHSSFFGIAPEAVDQPVEDGEDSWFGIDLFDYYQPLDEIERASMVELFNQFGLNIIPYRRNVELSLLAADFVEAHESNLIFRFYVPVGRMYADQTVEILSLFRDYLARALKFHVRQSTHATGRGTVYEFFGDGDMSQGDVTAKFSEFAKVMEMCIVDPSVAEQLLVAQGADANQVGQLVTLYTKKFRRINSDLRQERERKVLDIRHRLENELVEVASEADLDDIRRVVDAVIPVASGVREVMLPGAPNWSDASNSQTTINIRPQFINHVNGVVAQEIVGDQKISAESAQLLELIRKSNLPNALELQSSVYELEDPSSTHQKRVSAGRRLQALLGTIGNGALGVGFGVLQAYIESKLGIN